MKRFKLKELLNTKYLYITFVKDLNYILDIYLKLRADPTVTYNIGSKLLGEFYEAAKSEDLEIDLADMRITSDATYIINRFASEGVIFVDSLNKGRDNILKENRRRLKEEYTTVELPEYDGVITPKEWIASLKEDVIYKVEAGTSYCPMMLLIIMTQIVRPSIKFDMNSCIKDIMNKLSSYFTVLDYNNYDKFYIITNEGFFIWDRSEDLYIQRVGYCNLEEASNYASIVPYVFGTQKTLKDEIFGTIFKDCLYTVNEYRRSLPVPLSSYI